MFPTQPQPQTFHDALSKLATDPSLFPKVAQVWSGVPAEQIEAGIQNAFLVAWKGPKAERRWREGGEPALMGWLVLTGRRCVGAQANLYRNQNELGCAEQSIYECSPGAAGQASPTAAPVLRPDEAAEAQSLVDLLERLLSSCALPIPAEHRDLVRAALRLTWDEGLSQAAAAEQVGTRREYLSRTRSWLREQLAA